MILRSFTQMWGHTVHVHRQRKEDPFIFEILFDAELPDELSLILSDAIHNLRTVLDHATWELLGLDNAIRNRHTKLPTGDNWVNFEAACKGIKTPRQDTIDFFVKLAIYPKGAGETLYWLAQLDNAEKHTILSPVFQAASVKRIVFINLETGDRLVSENVTLRSSGPDGRAYIRCLPNYGIDCNDKFETTGAIVFGDVEGVPRQPILPTLMHFHDAVADTLWQFREFSIVRPK
jgi:hypothetical protein